MPISHTVPMSPEEFKSSCKQCDTAAWQQQQAAAARRAANAAKRNKKEQAAKKKVLVQKVVKSPSLKPVEIRFNPSDPKNRAGAYDHQLRLRCQED